MNEQQIEKAINNLTTEINVDGVESDKDRAALNRLLQSGGRPGKNSKYLEAIELLGGIATIEQIVFKIYELHKQVARPGDIRYTLKAKAKAGKLYIVPKTRSDGSQVMIYMLPDFKKKMDANGMGIHLENRQI